MDNLSEKIETVKLDFLNRFFRQLCYKRLKIRRIDIVEEWLAASRTIRDEKLARAQAPE